MDTQIISEKYIDGLLMSSLMKNEGVERVNAFKSCYHYNEKGQMTMEDFFQVDPITGEHESDDYVHSYSYEVIDEPDGGYTKINHYDDNDNFGEEVQYNNAGSIIRERNREVLSSDGEIMDEEKHYDSEGRLIDDISLLSGYGSHYEYVEEGFHKGRIIEYISSLDEDGVAKEKETMDLVAEIAKEMFDKPIEAQEIDESDEKFIKIERFFVGTFERNEKGRMSKMIFKGEETVYTYDGDGDIIKSTARKDYGDGNVTTITTSYSYKEKE